MLRTYAIFTDTKLPDITNSTAMDRYEYFRQFYDISREEYAWLTEGLRSKSFAKGEIIVAPGQVQRELYFINKGVQISHFESRSKMQVMAFTYPPYLCAVPGSFAMQQPSKYTVTSLTDTDTESVTYDQLQEVFDKSPAIERLFRKMTEALLAGVIDRHRELHSMTIEERYRAFCRRSPHLLHSVPHKYIASYLGIDATNFSKLYNRVKI
jgi:CRP-like cAMP-binding protein